MVFEYPLEFMDVGKCVCVAEGTTCNETAVMIMSIII